MNNKNKIIQKLAMPSAAKLIEEKKIDINTVVGTGAVSYTHLTLPTSG